MYTYFIYIVIIPGETIDVHLAGLPHHVADTALVTAWSWWSLLAVTVAWMKPWL